MSESPYLNYNSDLANASDMYGRQGDTNIYFQLSETGDEYIVYRTTERYVRNSNVSGGWELKREGTTERFPKSLYGSKEDVLAEAPLDFTQRRTHIPDTGFVNSVGDRQTVYVGNDKPYTPPGKNEILLGLPEGSTLVDYNARTGEYSYIPARDYREIPTIEGFSQVNTKKYGTVYVENKTGKMYQGSSLKNGKIGLTEVGGTFLKTGNVFKDITDTGVWIGNKSTITYTNMNNSGTQYLNVSPFKNDKTIPDFLGEPDINYSPLEPGYYAQEQKKLGKSTAFFGIDTIPQDVVYSGAGFVLGTTYFVGDILTGKDKRGMVEIGADVIKSNVDWIISLPTKRPGQVVGEVGGMYLLSKATSLKTYRGEMPLIDNVKTPAKLFRVNKSGYIRVVKGKSTEFGFATEGREIINSAGFDTLVVQDFTRLDKKGKPIKTVFFADTMVASREFKKLSPNKVVVSGTGETVLKDASGKEVGYNEFSFGGPLRISRSMKNKNLNDVSGAILFTAYRTGRNGEIYLLNEGAARFIGTEIVKVRRGRLENTFYYSGNVGADVGVAFLKANGQKIYTKPSLSVGRAVGVFEYTKKAKTGGVKAYKPKPTGINRPYTFKEIDSGNGLKQIVKVETENELDPILKDMAGGIERLKKPKTRISGQAGIKVGSTMARSMAKEYYNKARYDKVYSAEWVGTHGITRRNSRMGRMMTETEKFNKAQGNGFYGFPDMKTGGGGFPGLDSRSGYDKIQNRYGKIWENMSNRGRSGAGLINPLKNDNKGINKGYNRPTVDVNTNSRNRQESNSRTNPIMNNITRSNLTHAQKARNDVVNKMMEKTALKETTITRTGGGYGGGYPISKIKPPKRPTKYPDKPIETIRKMVYGRKSNTKTEGKRKYMPSVRAIVGRITTRKPIKVTGGLGVRPIQAWGKRRKR